MNLLRVMTACSVCALTTMGASNPSVAQDVARGVPSAQAASVTKAIMMRPVTVTLDGVPLTRALSAIAASADVHIQYRSDLLAVVNKVVSLKADKMPLSEALDRILSGSRMSAAPLTENIISVKPAVEEFGQTVVQGVITGKIINAKTKQPVAGATIRVGDAASSVVSGNDGTFRIPVDAGEHVVQVRMVGFVRQTRNVTVVDGETVSVEIALEASASVLDEVIVTGTVVATERKAIPTPITVITAEDIERRGITRVDEFFRGEVPGVIALDQGANVYFAGLGSNVSSRVYSRGSSTSNPPIWGTGDANPLKTYVDGVELMDASYLGAIDPQSIERIEIITGPQASTIYGSNAMGGVMQIFTKKGLGKSTPDITVNASYGVLQSNVSDQLTPTHMQQLNISGGTQAGFTYAGNISQQYSGQWRPNLFSQKFGGQIGMTYKTKLATMTASTSVTQAMNGTAKSAGRFGMGPVQAGNFVDMVTLQKMQTGEWGLGWPAHRFSSPQKSRTSSWLASLSIDFSPIQGWQHHMTIGRNQTNLQLLPYAPAFTYYNDTLYATQVRTGERTTVDYNTTWMSRWGSLLSSNLTIGANGSSGEQVYVNGCLANKETSAYINCSGAAGALSAGKPVSNASGGGFANWRVALYDKLFVTMGVRAESNNNYGREYGWDITPTQGITYTFDIDPVSVKLLTAYGRTTRPPNPDYRIEARSYIGSSYTPDSYISRLAAPEVGPEYTRGPSGGLEVYIGQLGMLSLNHYRQRVTDLLQDVLVDTIESVYNPTGAIVTRYGRQYQNVASVLQQGWDAKMSFRVWRVEFKGTYSWNTNKVTETKSNYSVPDLPAHFGNIGLGYAHGSVSVNFDMNYVGGSTTHWAQNHIFYLDNISSRLQMYVDRSALGGGSAAGPWKPGYWRGNMTALCRVYRNVSATLNMKNITSNYNTEVNDLVAAIGRQTQVGVSIRFP